MSAEQPLPVRLRGAIQDYYRETARPEAWDPNWEAHEIANGYLPWIGREPKFAARILGEIYGPHLNVTGEQILDALGELLVQCRREIPQEIWRAHHWDISYDVILNEIEQGK